MRAELFGYEKGAFTGATAAHSGLLARANGDTLFLDEVGDVSRELQRLLIKAVEEGRFQPLGSTKSIESAFRLLSATNIDEGRLAERLDLDFLDRIGPLRLRVPALREIPDELEWLWPNVLAEATKRARAPVARKQLTAPAHTLIVSKLRKHALPGNVRDLFGVAYRLLAVLSDPAGTRDDAVDFALKGLDFGLGGPVSQKGQVAQVAAAWAAGGSLDHLLGRGVSIKTDAVQAGLRRYLAEELRTAAARAGLPAGDLCDVSERTLRSWRSLDDGGGG
jgi:DNA-binding NtrC family response regulator